MSPYELITSKIVESIKQDKCVPWRKPWVSLSPRNLRGNQYRGINKLILSMVSYSDPRWLTFKQVKELGGRVQKGQRGTPVLYWKECQGQDEDRQFILARTYYVFNVVQTEGISLKPIMPSQTVTAESGRVEVLAMQMNPSPKLVSGDIACYVPSSDSVVMPRKPLFTSTEAYEQTLAHELIHATGHQSRLARKDVMNPARFGDTTYAFEELVAEIGSCFVCSSLSIGNELEQSASYVHGWLNVLMKDNSMVVRAASAAQKAADYLFSHQKLSLGFSE